jgi:hypothetical protein
MKTCIYQNANRKINRNQQPLVIMEPRNFKNDRTKRASVAQAVLALCSYAEKQRIRYAIIVPIAIPGWLCFTSPEYFCGSRVKIIAHIRHATLVVGSPLQVFMAISFSSRRSFSIWIASGSGVVHGKYRTSTGLMAHAPSKEVGATSALGTFFSLTSSRKGFLPQPL